MANSVDPDQTVCSGSTLLASTLNLSVMLGNYLQQTTSADDIFRYDFSRRHFQLHFFFLALQELMHCECENVYDKCPVGR